MYAVGFGVSGAADGEEVVEVGVSFMSGLTDIDDDGDVDCERRLGVAFGEAARSQRADDWLDEVARRAGGERAGNAVHGWFVEGVPWDERPRSGVRLGDSERLGDPMRWFEGSSDDDVVSERVRCRDERVFALAVRTNESARLRPGVCVRVGELDSEPAPDANILRSVSDPGRVWMRLSVPVLVDETDGVGVGEGSFDGCEGKPLSSCEDEALGKFGACEAKALGEFGACEAEAFGEFGTCEDEALGEVGTCGS